MFSFVLAIVVPVAFVSAATSTKSPTVCDQDNQQPNASYAYSIPAVVLVGSEIMNSTTKTWQIINSIWAQPLANDIVLDTSSTINAFLGSSPLPFAGCSFRFAANSGPLEKTSSDGSCGKIFGQSCLNEIVQLAQEATAAIPPAVGPSRHLIDLCTTVTQTVNNYILSSSKVCDKNGPYIMVTQPLNFSRLDIDNCTNPPTTSPISILGQMPGYPQENRSVLYDTWAKTATPILLALFSNDSALNSSTAGSFAQTYLTCTSPMTGSHYSTSAAGRSAMADVKSVVGFALAVNALTLLMQLC